MSETEVWKQITLDDLEDRVDLLSHQSRSARQEICVHVMGGQDREFLKTVAALPGVEIWYEGPVVWPWFRLLSYLPANECVLIVNPEVELWTQLVEPTDFGAMLEIYSLAPSFRTFSREYLSRDELVSALKAFSSGRHLLFDVKMDGSVFLQEEP